jgi:uncharacterized protein (TIGR02118 family)
MAGTKVVVVYPQPKDIEEFEKAYAEHHVPLAKNVKGIKKFVATRVVGTPDGSTPPFHRIAELHFASMDDVQTAFGDQTGKEAAAHAMAISTGGTPLIMIAEEE